MKNQDNINKVIEAFLFIDNKDLLERFLADLATSKELKDFGERFAVARLLYDGKTYEEIIKKTGMSSTTIARINRTLHEGENGYKDLLDKINNTN